jgi:septum formation protein
MTITIPSFILASASPARRKLLQTAGIDPIVRQSDFDESQIKTDNPQELVESLAFKKAATVSQEFPDALILGCDSVLAIDGEIHGKPSSIPEAIERWQKMRGNIGFLYTGHALLDGQKQSQIIRCGITKVYFAEASDREIIDYINSNEPLKCAGCFALEGKGGLFVEKIEGCHSNIIGLSLPLLRQMFGDLGYIITDFWRD